MMNGKDSYGSEGERLPSMNATERKHPDCPLWDKFRNGNGDPFKRANWTQILTAIIQTVFLICSLLGFVRFVEKRLDQLDAHNMLVTNKITTHINKDHSDRDMARMRLHNDCLGAQRAGCHPSVRFEKVEE